MGMEEVKVGAEFRRLTVLAVTHSYVGKGNRHRTLAEVRCSCGTVKTIRADALVYGNRTRSCGCLETEIKSKRFTERNKETAKFGSFSSKNPRTFLSWKSMKDRCYNAKQKAYKTYGAVGVRVCQFLRESPMNLVTLIGYRKKKLPSLDRHPEHDGNYTCGQCEECRKKGWELNIRWTTRQGQSENRGAFNVHLTAFGKTMLLSHWQEASGIDARRIMTRIRRDGWTVERALSTPDKKGNCYEPRE